MWEGMAIDFVSGKAADVSRRHAYNYVGGKALSMILTWKSITNTNFCKWKSITNVSVDEKYDQ